MVSVGQEGFADVEAGEAFFFAEERLDPILAEPGTGGAAGGAAADYEDVEGA